jgi:hypothetical protein
MREALLINEDIDFMEDNPTAARELYGAIIHLVAALGMGTDQIEPEFLAEVIQQSGLTRHFLGGIELTAEDIERAFNTKSNGRSLADNDVLELAQQATIHQLRQARAVTHCLSGFGAMYLMHGLLMPDTPGLAALRNFIDDAGLREFVLTMSVGLMETRGFVNKLVTCMSHPVYSMISDALKAQIENGPPLLHGPDEKHTGEAFMDDWINTIRGIRPTDA